MKEKSRPAKRPLSTHELDLIQLTCRLLAAESALETIAAEIGAARRSERPVSVQKLLQVLEGPQPEMHDARLPWLDASKSIVVAAESCEAHRTLLARLRPLLLGE